ncbi:hypothetical protein C8J57DRAFT_1239638 [Mycena rebaudengoi]|nr:hypothetical protein C8J57DRAFT_1239638 [Mycena rebaudengoi]
MLTRAGWGRTLRRARWCCASAGAQPRAGVDRHHVGNVVLWWGGCGGVWWYRPARVVRECGVWCYGIGVAWTRVRAMGGGGRLELGICASSDGCAPHSTPDDPMIDRRAWVLVHTRYRVAGALPSVPILIVDEDGLPAR